MLPVLARSAVHEHVRRHIGYQSRFAVETSRFATWSELRDLQHRAIFLCRFTAPRYEALMQLANTELEWISDRPRRRLLEVANEISRLVEAVNMVWERTNVFSQEVTVSQVEQVNRRLYILSVFAAIFLPLSFVADMLGVNMDPTRKRLEKSPVLVRALPSSILTAGPSNSPRYRSHCRRIPWSVRLGGRGPAPLRPL